MTTIKYILGTWLNGTRNYEQGIDILQRLTTDARRVAYFRKFQSETSKTSLYNEIETLYNAQQNPVSAPQDESMETLGVKLDMVDEWVNGEQGYYQGTRILEKLGADPGVVDFFMNHISGMGTSLLQNEMLKLHQTLSRLYEEERQRNAPPITMKDVLEYWLRYSDQDYTQGVNILSVLSEDEKLLSFFQNYNSDFARRRLVEELEKIYQVLKAPIVIKPTTATDEQAPARRPRNAELEVAAAHKASQLYKQMMNDRAVLFNLTKVEGWEDINSPDLVEQRRQLALKICGDNYDVSEAYDDLAHVQEHGTLPDSGEEEELQQGEIPDLELKPAIDNLRKALAKLRKKELTPERVALIQKNEARLEELLQRWKGLRQEA